MFVVKFSPVKIVGAFAILLFYPPPLRSLMLVQLRGTLKNLSPCVLCTLPSSLLLRLLHTFAHVGIFDHRHLKIAKLGCIEWHDVRTKFHENRLITTRVEVAQPISLPGYGLDYRGSIPGRNRNVTLP